MPPPIPPAVPAVPAAAPAPTSNFPRIAAWVLTGLTAMYMMYSCSHNLGYSSQKAPSKLEQKIENVNVPGSYLKH